MPARGRRRAPCGLISQTTFLWVAFDNAADQTAAYLTGADIDDNFHDGMGPGTSCADAPAPLPPGRVESRWN
jgi:hypothetical protein